MKHTKSIIVSIFALFLVAGTLKAMTMTPQEFDELRSIFGSQEQELGLATYEFQKYQSDLIGTRVGTTTTGVGFSITSTGGQSATSTYISRIGYQKNDAIFQIVPTVASSSANLYFEILGSTNDYCSVTATSTTDSACSGDCVLTSEIDWFDMGNFLKDKVHDTSFGTASTTLFRGISNPTPDINQTLVLENLGVECLRMDISGSSTEAYVGVTAK